MMKKLYIHVLVVEHYKDLTTISASFVDEFGLNNVTKKYVFLPERRCGSEWAQSVHKKPVQAHPERGIGS